MLKVNELRITNWVMLDGEPHFIRAGEHIDDYSDRMKGIELSSKLLKACGFEESFWLRHETPTFSILINKEFFHVGRYSFQPLSEGVRVADYTLIHLHQLQNLIFALTGTELAIDEKIFRTSEEEYC